MKKIMKTLLGFVLALAAPALLAQGNMVNPASQIRWPAVSGAALRGRRGQKGADPACPRRGDHLAVAVGVHLQLPLVAADLEDVAARPCESFEALRRGGVRS